MDDQRGAGLGPPDDPASAIRQPGRAGLADRRDRSRPIFVAPTRSEPEAPAAESPYRDAPAAPRAPVVAGPEGDDGRYETVPDERVSRPGREPRPGDPPLAPPPRSPRRLAFWLILLVLVIAGIVWLVMRTGHQPARTGRFTSSGAMPVGTATVVTGDMPITLTALGTVTPLATVTVKTQINGQLTEIGFQEGQHVKKGDFLAQIDPRPYQVALEQAQGQLAKDRAALKNAQTDLARYRTLVAQNSIARQTLDTQAATVLQDQATIQADQAQVDAQKLNLTYCHIIAPVTGRVGLRQVDPGNYVQTSDAGGIVVVTQLQPISVIFTLPEDNLPAVLKQVHAGATLQAVAYDRTGLNKLAVGTLETLDNMIDTSTGTVKLRATFDNKDEALFPNQFVNIRLLVSTMTGVDIVPVSAIERGAPGTFVYLVKPDDTVAVQKVKLGPVDGQRQAVLSGLQPGQKVVTDGADRLKEGAKVTEADATAKPGPPPAGKPPAGAAKTSKTHSGGRHHRSSQ